jgi:hypothetical protein
MQHFDLILQHHDLLLQHQYEKMQYTSETPETFVATCVFSATSPYCLGMEARQCVEFTGVELAGGAERSARGCDSRRVRKLEQSRPPFL